MLFPLEYVYTGEIRMFYAYWSTFGAKNPKNGFFHFMPIKS